MSAWWYLIVWTRDLNGVWRRWLSVGPFWTTEPQARSDWGDHQQMSLLSSKKTQLYLWENGRWVKYLWD